MDLSPFRGIFYWINEIFFLNATKWYKIGYIRHVNEFRMKQKLLLLLFTLLTLNLSFAGVDIPNNNWEDDLYGGIAVSLYPNPSSGIAFLEIDADFNEIYHVKVVNLIGKEIFQSEVQSGQKLKVDLQHMPAGVYFVQIERGDIKVTKRLIIR